MAQHITEKDLEDVREQYNLYKKFLTEEEIEEIEILLGIRPTPFIEWVTTQFYIPETNSPMFLDPLQRAALTEAMRLDANGNFIYTTVLWGDIKKSAKTCVAAARGLYAAIFNDYVKVRVVGNDKDQSQARIFSYIERAIKLNPSLQKNYRIAVRPSQANCTVYATGSTIEATSIDPEGEAGGGDDIIFTELWGAKGEQHLKFWTETTISPLRLGKSQRWAESYAGYIGQSPLLESLYYKIVEAGERISDDWPLYRDATGTMFAMWNHDPHCAWQTEEYYRQQEADLDASEFSRIHRNQWQTSQQAFIRDLSTIHSCVDDTLHPKLNESVIMVLASDAAYKRDHYGMVGVSYNEDLDLITVLYENEWIAPPGGEIQLEDPEKEVERLAQLCTVLVWAYDPYQLKRTSQKFESNNTVPTYSFIQQSKRLISDAALLDRIKTKDIIFPSGSKCLQHILNADVVKQSGDRMRMVKRQAPPGQDELPIDLAVALSMACYVAINERDTFPPPIRSGSQVGRQDRGQVGGGLTSPNKIGTSLPADVTKRTLPKRIN